MGYGDDFLKNEIFKKKKKHRLKHWWELGEQALQEMMVGLDSMPVMELEGEK